MKLPLEILTIIADYCDMDTKMRLRRSVGLLPKKVQLDGFEGMYAAIPKAVIKYDTDVSTIWYLNFGKDALEVGSWGPRDQRMESPFRFSDYVDYATERRLIRIFGKLTSSRRGGFKR